MNNLKRRRLVIRTGGKNENGNHVHVDLCLTEDVTAVHHINFLDEFGNPYVFNYNDPTSVKGTLQLFQMLTAGLSGLKIYSVRLVNANTVPFSTVVKLTARSTELTFNQGIISNKYKDLAFEELLHDLRKLPNAPHERVKISWSQS